MDHKRFRKAVADLYRVIGELEKMFPGRRFTPDGHLVGSLGECLVANRYKLKLAPLSNPGFDAKTVDGLRVEIKATQGAKVAFRSCPDHAIVIRLNKDGSFDEFYNGPGAIVWSEFEGRTLPKNGQFQIGLSKLKTLDKRVAEAQRVPRRQPVRG